MDDIFTDKYFAGIDIDLSKCLFIFSYNHEHRINPILKDRLTQIQFNSFSKREKLSKQCICFDIFYGAFSDCYISSSIKESYK